MDAAPFQNIDGSILVEKRFRSRVSDGSFGENKAVLIRAAGP
jgi:hypothetical protein